MGIVMLHFYHNLYISPSVKGDRKKIIWKLRTGRPQPFIYVIALTKNNDLMEIYHSSMLKQKFFKKNNAPHYIIGIAASRSDSIDMAGNIILDVYNESNTYNVREYFMENWKKR